MATTATDEATGPLGRSTVIDVDVHVGGAIDFERVADHLEEPHRSRLVNHSHAHPLPLSGWDRNTGGKIDPAHHAVGDADGLDTRLCGEFGVDHPVCNTTSWVTRLPETEFAVALARGYNDVLVEDFLDVHDHFYGLATIATQDPEAAAEEVDRLAGEDQIVGAYVATGGPDRPLGDPSYDVFYRALEDAGWPVVYHGHADAFISDFSRQNQALETYASVSTLAHPWNQMLTLTSLVEQGTFAKFPDLDFVFLEAGLLWAAYTTFRLNKTHAMQPAASPLLEDRPETYIREQCWFGTQPIEEPLDPGHLKAIVELVGPDSMLFASDYPHWDFDNPEAVVGSLAAAIGDDDALKRVLFGNASEVFGIGG